MVRTQEFYDAVTALVSDVETGILDAEGDFPEVGECDLSFEITLAVVQCSGATREVQEEACRSMLGFVPISL